MLQDDDLGVLAASFNRMQAGLAERQRLQAAFGNYVDPALAARLLEQGDDVFTGERREVTVMFVDVRDFTPFAEANSAEDTVARLNALFEIVVPAVVDAGGHVNKFLGDGALAVFGAPNDLANHADAAAITAVAIQRMVAERFDRALRIGIGINTGPMIAGTIGGGGKLEFTLNGDTVNVAARVEQLTKTTGDAILLTHQSVDALTSRPLGLTDRGSHALKGKSAEVRLFGLESRPDVFASRRPERLTFETTETAIVEKPADEDEHGTVITTATLTRDARNGAPPVYRRGCFVSGRWSCSSRLQLAWAFSACCRRGLSVAVGDSAWVLSRTTETAAVDKPAFIDNSSAPTTPLANGACGILSANRGVSCLRGRDRHGDGGLQRPQRQPGVNHHLRDHH